MLVEIAEDRIARQPPEAQEMLRALVVRNAELEARIAQLEEQLGRSPRNSSKPPSSEHPHAGPPKKTRDKNRNKNKNAKWNRGGQPGHTKHERPLIPSDQCDEVHSLKPPECRRCGTELTGEDADPLRHQVWELPEIKPLVIEYQRHRLSCPCCGESTYAELPPAFPAGSRGRGWWPSPAC